MGGEVSLRAPSWRAVWAAAGTKETGREGFLQGCEESPTRHWGELAGYERVSWARLIPARLEGTSWSRQQSLILAGLLGSVPQTVPDSLLALLGTQGGLTPISCSQGLRGVGEGLQPQ